jgi:hypothetical protein
MKLLAALAFAFATTSMISAVDAGKDKYIDGNTTYKFAGVDGHFPVAADACKAGVEDLAKHGNKKTYDSVKEGSSSTSMTCVLKESDGSIFEQANILTKILECPDTTSPRSSDNSGNWSAMKCHCDDAKKGCPAPAKK